MTTAIVPFFSRAPYRLCLLVCLALSALGFGSRIAQAAPIQLQATYVSEGNLNCNSFFVQGANFSFSSNITGYCSGPPIGVSPGGYLTSVVSIYASYSYPVPGRGDTLGNINVPENPGRVALFTGSITSDRGYIAIPLVNQGPSQVERNLFLQGTLSACLLPAGASRGPCDPGYLNFATVNVYVAGTDVFSGYCSSSYICFFDEEHFIGTADAVPEPASLGLVGLSGFFLLLVGRRSRNLQGKRP